MTEIPVPYAGRVAYDATCAVCQRWAQRFAGAAARRGFFFLPLQDPQLAREIRACQREPTAEMHLLLRDGRVLGGADALLVLARAIPSLRPLYWVSMLPGGRPLIRRAYRWFARRRHCLVPMVEPTGGAKHRRHCAFFEDP